MNAGIVILQDGTPCLVYDEALPHPVSHVAFSRNDFQLTLVYDMTGAEQAVQKPGSLQASSVMQGSKIARMIKTPQGRKLEYPLDPAFAQLLEARKNMALGVVQQGQLSGVRMIPVVIS